MTLGHRVPEAGQPAWVFSPRNSEPGSREQPVTERLWDRGPSWPPSGTTPGHPGAPGSRTPGPPGPIQAPAEEVLLWDPGLGAGAGGKPGDRQMGSCMGPSPVPGLSLHPPGSVLSPAATPPPHPHPATQTERLVPLSCRGALGPAWGGAAGEARLCG